MSYNLYNLVWKYSDVKDKVGSIQYYVRTMLNRSSRMFDYKGLPLTIPQRELEVMLQTKGVAIIGKAEDGELYALSGSWGGKPNAYYIPTEFVVANPYLPLNKTFKVNEDCVLLRNDTMYLGLMDLYARYASLLTESDITLRLIDIRNRAPYLVTANNDTSKESARKVLKDIEDGKEGVIGEKSFLYNEKDISTSPFAPQTNSSMQSAIEYHQYLKASWYNEIGLNANYNMKREALNSSESALNDDILTPLVDDMLQCRKEFVNLLNEKFGLNVSVELASAWRDNKIELENALESEGKEYDGQEIDGDTNSTL